jgi:hypothetical protein
MPIAWSVSVGALPAGLTLNGAGTGALISGTPTTAGSGSPGFTIRAVDKDGDVATKDLSILVNPEIVITTASLSGATVGTFYSKSMAATGGTGALAWSVSSGSLPAGLGLTPATGLISGTPNTVSAPTFTIKATDTAGAFKTKVFTITVSAALSVTTTSLPAATSGTFYSTPLASSGGTGTPTWSLSTGSLPAGLTLSPAGVISGTPTATAGNFTVQALDGAGAIATKLLSITVNPALTVTTTSLNAATTGARYTAQLTSSGGTGTPTWSVITGSLPTGLTLSTGGLIDGTPTATAGNFTVQALDGAGANATQSLSITVNPALTITTTSLPAATAGTAYSAPLASSGGTGTPTWSLLSGSLPTGLTLSPAGVIGGTPTAAAGNFTVQALDGAGAKATQVLSISVGAALSISTNSLSNATAGAAYNRYFCFIRRHGHENLVGVRRSTSGWIEPGQQWCAFRNANYSRRAQLHHSGYRWCWSDCHQRVLDNNCSTVDDHDELIAQWHRRRWIFPNCR